MAPSTETSKGKTLDLLADLILFAGFLGCAGVAVNWIPLPEANATRETATKAQPAGDPRFGTWASPVNKNWTRTAKISPTGANAARIALSYDFITSEGIQIPGALGEYAANAILNSGDSGQAADSAQICQIRLEWGPGTLTLKQKGVCGEASNLAPDGLFTGKYTKLEQPPSQPLPAPRDCGSLNNDAAVFCKDPALRAAREANTAILADAIRQLPPSEVASFEEADRNWQAEVRRVCMATEVRENADEARSHCFGQSYEARMAWLRLHTGLVHLANYAAKEERAQDRYAEALGAYLDTYGALGLQLPMFAPRLRTLIPAKELHALEEAMTNRGPRGGLFQKGCGPQGCDASEAAFDVDPVSGQVTAALRLNTRIVVYSFAGETEELPSQIHEWLSARASSVSQILYKP